MSIAINILTGGHRGEMLCARAYRRGWRIVPLLDWLMREPGHCEACHDDTDLVAHDDTRLADLARAANGESE